MEDLSQIFNVSAKNIFKQKESTEENVFYKPTLDKGVDKVYTSQLVFLPNALNPSLSLINKWTVWIENADTGTKMNVDCPSTVKKPSLLQDAYFACRKSNSAHERELQKLFKRKKELYSLVYIVKDEHQPDYEGKIKIFKFGQQILDILENAANDSDEPIDFLDIFNNKIFKLVINETTTGDAVFPNYKLSKFLNKSHEFEVNGKKIKKTKEDMKVLAGWLKENTPDMEPYAYKEWDEETRKIVVDYIKSNVNSGELISKILKTSAKDITSKKSTKSPAKPVVDDLEDEDLDFDDFEEEKPKSNAKKQKPVVEEVYDDDFDEDLDGLFD